MTNQICLDLLSKMRYLNYLNILQFS